MGGGPPYHQAVAPPLNRCRSELTNAKEHLVTKCRTIGWCHFSYGRAEGMHDSLEVLYREQNQQQDALHDQGVDSYAI